MQYPAHPHSRTLAAMSRTPRARLSAMGRQFAIMEWLMLNPGRSLTECARDLGMPQATVYRITSSDMFRQRYMELMNGRIDERVMPVRDRLVGIAAQAADKLSAELARPDTDPEFALRVVDKVLARVNYAQPPAQAASPAGPVSVTVNVADPELLRRARERLIARAKAEAEEPEAGALPGPDSAPNARTLPPNPGALPQSSNPAPEALGLPQSPGACPNGLGLPPNPDSSPEALALAPNPGSGTTPKPRHQSQPEPRHHALELAPRPGGPEGPGLPGGPPNPQTPAPEPRGPGGSPGPGLPPASAPGTTAWDLPQWLGPGPRPAPGTKPEPGTESGPGTAP